MVFIYLLLVTIGNAFAATPMIKVADKLNTMDQEGVVTWIFADPESNKLAHFEKGENAKTQQPGSVVTLNKTLNENTNGGPHLSGSKNKGVSLDGEKHSKDSFVLMKQAADKVIVESVDRKTNDMRYKYLKLLQKVFDQIIRGKQKKTDTTQWRRIFKSLISAKETLPALKSPKIGNANTGLKIGNTNTGLKIGNTNTGLNNIMPSSKLIGEAEATAFAYVKQAPSEKEKKVFESPFTKVGKRKKPSQPFVSIELSNKQTMDKNNHYDLNDLFHSINTHNGIKDTKDDLFVEEKHKSILNIASRSEFKKDGENEGENNGSSEEKSDDDVSSSSSESKFSEDSKKEDDDIDSSEEEKDVISGGQNKKDATSANHTPEIKVAIQPQSPIRYIMIKKTSKPTQTAKLSSPQTLQDVAKFAYVQERGKKTGMDQSISNRITHIRYGYNHPLYQYPVFQTNNAAGGTILKQYNHYGGYGNLDMYQNFGRYRDYNSEDVAYGAHNFYNTNSFKTDSEGYFKKWSMDIGNIFNEDFDKANNAADCEETLDPVWQSGQGYPAFQPMIPHNQLIQPYLPLPGSNMWGFPPTKHGLLNMHMGQDSFSPLNTFQHNTQSMIQPHGSLYGAGEQHWWPYTWHHERADDDFNRNMFQLQYNMPFYQNHWPSYHFGAQPPMFNHRVFPYYGRPIFKKKQRQLY